MKKPYLLKTGADDCLLSPGMTEADYVKLRNQWYKKLKDLGFEDIEFGLCAAGVQELPWPTGTVSAAKRRTSREINVIIELDEERAAADFYDNYNYWAMCRQFLHAQSRRAPKGQARAVWTLYCEGLKGREISRQLKVANSTVQRIIHRTEIAMWEWWRDTADAREEELALRQAAEEFEK